MYLFFDTETTGLPINWKAPVSALNNWPRLVQLAWLHYDKDGNKIGGNSYIIKPEGFTIPSDASRVHGITTDRALSEGIALQGVLNDFQNLISQASYLVAHNMSFDEKIVGAEFLRKKWLTALRQRTKSAQWKNLPATVSLMGLMDTSGLNFLNSITNFSGLDLKKNIMQQLTSKQHLSVFGK